MIIEKKCIDMISVLVVGETCLDKFVYCKTEKLSPEAPIPVVVPIETITSDGMSGNVVRNMFSINQNLSITHWHQMHIITKTRFVDKKSNHIFLRVDEGDFNIEKFDDMEYFLDEVRNFDIVVVSDYNKSFLSDQNIIDIGSNSRLSILDSKRKLNKSIVEKFDFVKLNEKEFDANQDVQDYTNIIVTLGDKGSRFGEDFFPSTNPKQTIDVSGAGDTFTSSFILEYYQTRNIKDSINFANEMSSIVVSKKGVSTPN